MLGGDLGPWGYNSCSLLPIVHPNPLPWPCWHHPWPQTQRCCNNTQSASGVHGRGQCIRSTSVLFSLGASMCPQPGVLQPWIVLMPPSLALGLVLAASSSSGPWNN